MESIGSEDVVFWFFTLEKLFGFVGVVLWRRSG